MTDPYTPYILQDGQLINAPRDLSMPSCIPVRQAFAPAEIIFTEDANDCPCGTPSPSVETGTGECSACS